MSNNSEPNVRPDPLDLDSTAETAAEKHDKVLHTRISPTLDREIKRRARNLGMSVSTIVRNVLLHTFDLVEDIVHDSASVALSIAGDGEAGTANAHNSNGIALSSNSEVGEVIGWQEVVLNLNAVCNDCNTILATGSKAAIGIRDTPGPRVIICSTCLDKLAEVGDK